MRHFPKLIDLPASLSLLTRLPIPGDHGAYGARAAASVWAHPVSGALIGATLGAVYAGAQGLGAAPLAAAAAAAGLGLWLTGALHEDGLADFADGMGGGWTRERRLEIMKDSRIGGYGAAALAAALMLRIGALAAMSGMAAVVAMAAAGAISRAPFGAIMRWTPSARPGGLADGAGRPGALPCGLALAAAGAAAIGAPNGGAALCLGLAAAAIVAAQAKRLIGGHTGDVLGAAQQAAECAALLALTAQ